MICMAERTFPKVLFRPIELGELLYYVDYFLNNTISRSKNWDDTIYKDYPVLAAELDGVTGVSDRKNIETAFFEEVLETDKGAMSHGAELFQKEWDALNDRVMAALEDIVEIRWPASDKSMLGLVTPLSISPRTISKRTFLVSHKYSTYGVKTIAIHEILHFIYFEKWKEVFPGTRPGEFEAPHLVWRLSEIVPNVILGDKRMQDVFRRDFKSHYVYHETDIGGRPLLSYIQDFYNSRKDFAGFLKDSWEFVKAHDSEIP